MSGYEPFATARRLHPASVVLGVPARQLLQVILFPVVVTFAGASPSIQNGLQLFLVFAGIGLVMRTLSHQRRLFSFDGQVVRVSSGVFARQHRSLAVDRIQQVELRRTLPSRIFGCTTVRIETAASASEPEVELRVIAHADALAFRDAVRSTAHANLISQAAHELVLSVPARHLALAALTGNRLLALPGIVFAGFQLIGGQLGSFEEELTAWLADPPDLFGASAELLSLVALPSLIAAAVSASLLSALAVTFVRDGHFTITRQSDEFHVSRGIFATRESVIKINRIQLIELKQNWLRRMFRVVTVRLQSAGGDADARVLIPLVKVDQVHQLLATLLTEITNVPLLKHPRAARYRSVLRWLRFSLPVAVGIAFSHNLPPNWPLSTLLPDAVALRAGAAGVALLAAVLLGLASYQLRRHAITNTLVLSQTGTVNRRLLIAPVRKIQTVGVRTNLFQRRLNLASLLVRVAGTRANVIVHDADTTAIDEHAHTLTKAAAMCSPR